MSIDTLTPGDTDSIATTSYTAAVRTYITRGVEQVDGSIAVAERHLAELDRRRADVNEQFEQTRAATEEHLARLVLSRAQLLGFLGGEQAHDDDGDGDPELPTFVCPCGRIAVVEPQLGPVHDTNGTHVPAGETCRMPILGDLSARQDWAAAGGEASAA